MIYPHKNNLSYRLMTWYANHILRNNFQKINIIGEYTPGTQSVLVLGNHSSWWDGFWMLHLNNALLKKHFYILMLEKELKKRMFFSKVGAYSINPADRQIKDSLIFTGKLLNEGGNMVVYYPEGKFSPATIVNKEFQKGISMFYKNKADFSTLFVAAITDYFSHRKPTLNLYIKQVHIQTGSSHGLIEREYNTFYNASTEKQKLFAL